MADELKPRCIRHSGLLEPVVGCDGCLICQLKSDIGDLQSELKKTKAELKFASDEHGKADAECEQLSEKVQNLQQESMLSRTAAHDAGLDLQRANEDRNGLRIRLGAVESALADMRQLRYKAEHAVLYQDEKMRRLKSKADAECEQLREANANLLVVKTRCVERIYVLQLMLLELGVPTDVVMKWDKGGEEKVPMTTETKEDSLVEQAAVDFILAMSKRNEEPADRIASHRILHLSCKQFDAWIALKRAVEDKSLTVEDQAGVKMLIALQKVLGITESPEGALARWRQMPEPQKDEVWKMYKTIAP